MGQTHARSRTVEMSMKVSRLRVLSMSQLKNPAPTADEHRTQVRRAAIASTIGTTIEWYDYFLYGTASALVFPHLFFPGVSPYIGTLAAFATYFVGFLARPVGAAIFGHWGDRIGRKVMLIVTLLMMGISTALIGILPGSDSWGDAAPMILILLRVIQGIAVGGEWCGSVLLSMEWGDQKRRGLMGSWPQLGVAIGLILSTGMMTIFNGIFGKDAFVTWGFRIPFLLSLVLVAIGLYIRLKIMETPQFSKVVAQQETTTAPLLQVFRRFPKEIILAALLRMSEQMPFYVVTAFVLSYMTSGEHGHYLYVQLRAHRHAHRRRGRIRPGPTVRTLLRHDRTEEDLRVGCGHHGRVGLRLLRSPGQRRHLAGVPRAVPRTRPSRHAVRPAGVDHRRILPNEPPLHGSGARIPAFVDHRRWP